MADTDLSKACDVMRNQRIGTLNLHCECDIIKEHLVQ